MSWLQRLCSCRGEDTTAVSYDISLLRQLCLFPVEFGCFLPITILLCSHPCGLFCIVSKRKVKLEREREKRCHRKARMGCRVMLPVPGGPNPWIHSCFFILVCRLGPRPMWSPLPIRLYLYLYREAQRQRGIDWPIYPPSDSIQRLGIGRSEGSSVICEWSGAAHGSMRLCLSFIRGQSDSPYIIITILPLATLDAFWPPNILLFSSGVHN